MSQAPAMPVFTDALIGDTTHLSTEEFGAYCLILFATWRNGGMAFDDNDRRMARICRVTEARWLGKLRAALVGFFDMTAGTWRQKRLEKEWKYCAELRAKNSDAGKASARARVLKNNDTVSTSVVATLQPNGQRNGNPHTHTLKEESKEEKKDSRSSAVADGDVFEIWWKEVPRKVGKGQARKAHHAALKKAGSDVLLAGIKAYANSRAGQDEQYTAHPATWLNGERWLDAEGTKDGPMRSVPTGPPPLPEDIWPDFKTMGAAH